MPKTNKLAKSKPGPSTQKYLDIAEIREDVVVMRDGTLRAVLLVGSINFALKSEEEQEAIISAYVGFLNSIDYPLQIVVQSRKLNIDDYLRRLMESEKAQTNDLLRLQIADYRKFVGELVTLGEIMSKRFFMVVTYDPVSNKQKGFFARLRELFTPALVVRLKGEKFLERKNELIQRLGHVQGGLKSMGLDSAVLDTQSLIELYYNVYNPDLSETQKLVDVGKIQVEE